MATRKAEKLREDAYRQNLENGIKSLLASQAQVVEELRELTKRLKALEEKRNVKPSQTRR